MPPPPAPLLFFPVLPSHPHPTPHLLSGLPFGSWKKVFHQDSVNGGYFADADAVKYTNADSPDSALYSILGDLEEYRSGGTLTFMMVWPELTGIDGHNFNLWSQTSNPLESTDDVGPAQGYVGIEVHFDMAGDSGHSFGGLIKSTIQGAAAIDGSVGDEGCAYNALGFYTANADRTMGGPAALSTEPVCDAVGYADKYEDGGWCFSTSEAVCIFDVTVVELYVLDRSATEPVMRFRADDVEPGELRSDGYAVESWTSTNGDFTLDHDWYESTGYPTLETDDDGTSFVSFNGEVGAYLSKRIESNVSSIYPYTQSLHSDRHSR